MTADVVWVSPSSRVKTAVILMKGHDISALPVVSGEAVVGLVTEHGVLGEPPDTPITDVMDKDYVAVEPEMTAVEAADEMNRTRASHLLVLEGSRLIGIVSRTDLMPEVGKNYDPLTGLQWSDSFREWAMAALKRGLEISVIFFDLDRFGLFNKKHGHVVGDNVLKEVAEVVKTGISLDTDFACRYGGDEFVVVSSRHADDAAALADALKQRIDQIRIAEVPEGVSGTYGIFGGRRTREREDIHFAATVDTLITRASKNCTAKKRELEAVPEAPAAAQPPAPSPIQRLKIGTLTISTTDTEAKVIVTLTRGGREFSHEASARVTGTANTLRLVTEAAASAASASLPQGYGIVVEAASVHSAGTEEDIVSVVTTFVSPRWSVRHVGSAVVRRGDQYRAAVAALLASVNRLLETAEG